MYNLKLGNRMGIFAVLWLFFYTIPMATMANEVYGIIATESSALNIRAGADSNSPVIAKAEKGATLRILGNLGSWYQVLLPNGAVGYASSAYIRLAGVPTPNESYGVVATESTLLNIRTGPGEKYQVIGTAQKGITLRILGKEGSWYKIQDGNGLVGYAKSNYMRLLPRNNSAPSYSPPPADAAKPADTANYFPLPREVPKYSPSAIPQQQPPNYGSVPRQQQYQPSLESSVKEICNQIPVDAASAIRFSLFCDSGNSSLPPEVIASSKKRGCEGNCLMDHTGCVVSHIGSSHNSDNCDLQRKKCEQSCQ